MIANNFKKLKANGEQQDASSLDGDDDEVEGEDDNGNSSGSGYNYLLSMSLWSLTREHFERLLQQRDQKEEELNVLLGKTATNLWEADLDEFMEAYEAFLKKDEEERESLASNGKKKPAKRRARNTASSKDQPASKKLKTEPKETKVTKEESFSSDC